MFGAQYGAQLPFASVPESITVRRGTGGGWSSRGAFTPMPKKRPTGLPELPKLPKPPYLFFTVTDGG